MLDFIFSIIVSILNTNSDQTYIKQVYLSLDSHFCSLTLLREGGKKPHINYGPVHNGGGGGVGPQPNIF